jgi:hypothetical protein
MMLSKLIPDLEPSGQLRPHVAMIESSRFCVDTSLEQGKGRQVPPPLLSDGLPGRHSAEGEGHEPSRDSGAFAGLRRRDD